MVNEYINYKKVGILKKVSLIMAITVLVAIFFIYFYNLFLDFDFFQLTFQAVFNFSIPTAICVILCYFEDKISNIWKYVCLIYLISSVIINIIFVSNYYYDPHHLWLISYCPLPLIGEIIIAFNFVEVLLILSKKFLKVLDLICLLDFIMGIGGIIYYIYTNDIMAALHYLLSHIPFAFMFLFAYPDRGLTDVFCYDTLLSDSFLRLFIIVPIGVPLITFITNFVLVNITSINSVYNLYTIIFCCSIVILWLFILVYARKLNRDDLIQKKELEHLDEAIKDANEKTVLIKEVHHRVKNNLQVMNSFINLEQKFHGDNPQRIVDMTKSRISSLALLHESIYNEKDMNFISIKDFITDFDSNLKNLSNFSNIKFVDEIEDLVLSVKIITPLVLIINELTTNSFKYAFDEDSEKNQIFKSFSRIEEKNGKYKYVLHYKDNGRGLPEDLDLKKSNSLGWTIIKSLSAQLNGEFKVFNDNGYNFILSFEISDD